MSRDPEARARRLFQVSVALVAAMALFGYGVAAGVNRLPPVPALAGLYRMVSEVLTPSDRILETEAPDPDAPAARALRPDAMAPGLTLVAGISQGRDTRVVVIDAQGTVHQQWDLAWTEVWPEDEGEFPEGRRPEAGMYLHGVTLLPGGDLVANFEHLSTFRMDVCGNVVWKRDNLGHHSAHYSAGDDTIWVAAERYIAAPPTGYPLHDAPLRSWTAQQLSPGGEVLRDIPVIEILIRNDLEGLLYLSSLHNAAPFPVSGDTLHLNDVEVFPAGLESAVFAPGDLMLSLRNINTVLVVDPQSLEVKFITTGAVVRHHDPDFMAGDVISIFDNQNFTLDGPEAKPASRIVEIDAATGARRTVLGDTPETQFFTNIMGTHQRLANGNILVNESARGRILEFTPSGALAFSYDNRVGAGRNGRTFAARRLPPDMDAAFFTDRQQECTQ
jgi:hypothetical protein